jgi:hypothetical protein
MTQSDNAAKSTIRDILPPETPEWQARLIERIEEALDRGEEIHLLYPWEYRR